MKIRNWYEIHEKELKERSDVEAVEFMRNNRRAASCMIKKPMDTYEEAKNAQHRMEKKNPGSKFRVYVCPRCHKYHLTSKK